MTENGLDLTKDLLSRIYNCEETGLSTDLAGKQFIAKQCKSAYLTSPKGGKTNFLVLFCVSAAGVYLPPFVVYKLAHLYETWTVGGPPNTRYACTPNGWMQDVTFENWFLNCFVEHVKGQEKPLILYFDGHGSHLTFKTIDIAMKESIMIICLPMHTSHALQPLYVAVFKPLKDLWKKILQRKPNEVCFKSNFPISLGPALVQLVY